MSEEGKYSKEYVRGRESRVRNISDWDGTEWFDWEDRRFRLRRRGN